MTTPGLPSVPQILPRQPGESEYQYRKRRMIELTGETPYQRRKRLGQARGLSTSEARGHAPRGGQTEYQRRRAQTLRQYGKTPWELWRDQRISWLTSEGYTPQTTGWSWNRLIQISPKLQYLNDRASPGGQITPDMMMQATDMEQTGALEKDWSWYRLNEKYTDTYDYLEMHNNTDGRAHWFLDRIPELPAAWWYYH